MLSIYRQRNQVPENSEMISHDQSPCPDEVKSRCYCYLRSSSCIPPDSEESAQISLRSMYCRLRSVSAAGIAFTNCVQCLDPDMTAAFFRLEFFMPGSPYCRTRGLNSSCVARAHTLCAQTRSRASFVSHLHRAVQAKAALKLVKTVRTLRSTRESASSGILLCLFELS